MCAMYAAGILYSFVFMMLSVYVTTQRMIIFQQATDYYPFNICCIESLQCISCVIKFNSGRKHSNYIYRTTPLFLSTHQKISTKNDLWVSCTCTPGKGPVGMLYGLMPRLSAHTNHNIYYYSVWSEQWQPTVRQIHCIISANKVTIVNNNYCSDGVVQVFMCLSQSILQHYLQGLFTTLPGV